MLRLSNSMKVYESSLQMLSNIYSVSYMTFYDMYNNKRIQITIYINHNIYLNCLHFASNDLKHS